MNEAYANQRIKEICSERLLSLYAPDEQERANCRLEREMALIKANHYTELYLWFYDFVRQNKLHPLQYSVRGCAAGSIVCFLLGITKCDPLDTELPLYQEFYMGRDGSRAPIIEMNADWDAFDFDYPPMPDNFDPKMITLIPHENCTLNMRMFRQTGYLSSEKDFSSESFRSLFSSPEALDMEADKSFRINSGMLGVPGYGSLALFKMIEMLNPQTKADMAKLEGLFHGTDIWCKNGEWLVSDGMEKLATIIANREDVYEMLLSHGFPEEKSFQYAEVIRKGYWARGRIDFDLEEELYSHGVPGHVVWSLEQIRYLFPRAHAAEYLQMELRALYYKWKYPELYYDLYFELYGNDFIKKYHDEWSDEMFSQCGKDVFEDTMESFYQYLVWYESRLRWKEEVLP